MGEEDDKEEKEARKSLHSVEVCSCFPFPLSDWLYYKPNVLYICEFSKKGCSLPLLPSS